MIVRDEESVLARSLSCAAAVADEVIVVDTGSSDGSAEIASRAGAKVFGFKWQDDFAAARNYSFSLASCDYIMWLDADDVIEEEDARTIKTLVAAGGFDVAMLKYVSAPLCYYRERILRRSMNFVWQGVVHEVIAPRGNVVYSDAKIIHKKVKRGDPMRNLSIYQKHIARGICLDERQKFYYGRELFYNKMYVSAVAVLENFLKGGGWNVNKAEACRTLYYCHTALGEREAALRALVGAFIYLPPCAEDCCLLAAHFLGEGNLDAAEYWYARALDCPADMRGGGFVNADYSVFVPCIGLASVADRRGDYAAANMWNERAGAAKPHSQCYLHNKIYLASRLKGHSSEG